MKVLYITRAKLSLSRAHTQNIIKTAEHLNMQSGFSVTVFSSSVERKTIQEVFNAKAVKKSFLLDISSRRRFLFWKLWSDRGAFDLLYFRDPMLWPHAFLARYVFGKKVVFEVHGSHEWRFASLWWKLSLASAHGLVFITQSLKEYYNPKKPSIVVHTNGVDLGVFEKHVDINALRHQLQLPEDKKIIMYVGSFLWHSLDKLIDISNRLPVDVVMVIVGIAGRERTNSLPRNIIWVDRVEPKDIPQYLLGADILINPLSVKFPSSISSKLYEYLAAGKPIISTRGGANGEILINGENGLLVESLDSGVFVESIKRIFNDVALRSQLSKSALISARQYTWETRGEKIAQLLRQT